MLNTRWNILDFLDTSTTTNHIRYIQSSLFVEYILYGQQKTARYYRETSRDKS